MADDFLGSLQQVLQNEIQQQQSTDWGSILARSLAAGAKGAVEGFKEAKPNDYGSQIALALIGGGSEGYEQQRKNKIRNDILGGLSSSIDAMQAGDFTSLPEALKANELGNLANAVTTDNYNFDLGLGRARQEQQMKNDLALQLIKDKISVELEDYKNRQRFSTDQAIRQQNAIFSGGEGEGGEQGITAQSIASDANLAYPEKMSRLMTYLRRKNPGLTANAAGTMAENVLKNQVLDSANLPESTRQIMAIVPTKFQNQAFKEIGILQNEANSLQAIDTIFEELKQIPTIEAYNPTSRLGARFGAGKGVLDLEVVKNYKGVMSENDYQRMRGLLPEKYDTVNRLEEKRQKMKGMITALKESGTPILSQFGITGFQQRDKVSPQAFGAQQKTQKYPEGTIIKNAQGIRKIMRNGNWEDI